MRYLIILTLWLAAVVMMPAPSAADTALAAGITAKEMAALLESYPEVEAVEIRRGRYGNPAISASTEGIRFEVFLFHCESPSAEARCGEVQYKATFVPAEGRAAEAAAAAKRWDQDWVFGRAFVEDDDDVVIEHSHVAGGTGLDYMQQNASLWLLSILPDFRRTLGY